MGKLIVNEFTTVDGVVEDPDGSGAMPDGGWAFRFGPEGVAGDKFELGPLLDTGVMLLGRRTWEHFATLWPTRTDPFSTRMNAIPKLVVSHSPVNTDAWRNSAPIGDDLVTTVRRTTAERDVIVTGSLSVVRALADHGLVDEYRLIVFPTIVGHGRRLFTDRTPPTELRLLGVERKGAAVLSRYGRA